MPSHQGIADSAESPYQTKWSLLQDKLAKLESEIRHIQDELKWMERTPFNSNFSGTNKCSACQTVMETEADFAKHFYVPDARYPNLGNCPNQMKWITRDQHGDPYKIDESQSKK